MGLEELPAEDDSVLYDIAREVTDEVLGEGSYAHMHRHSSDPAIKAALARAAASSSGEPCA